MMVGTWRIVVVLASLLWGVFETFCNYNKGEDLNDLDFNE